MQSNGWFPCGAFTSVQNKQGHQGLGKTETIYKRGRGVEFGATVKQLQPAVKARREPGTDLRISTRRPYQSTTLPVYNCIQY